MDSTLESLKVKLFADGADISGMKEMASKAYISGLTTNPTLMRKAGITNYGDFARGVLEAIPDKPISFEVFSDDLEEMKSQAVTINSWGKNVFVKIPITNTRGDSTAPLIKYLASRGVKVNVTALMTVKQVDEIIGSLNLEVESYVSIFAGRIADTGRDPVPIMKECIEKVSINSSCQIIWASPRELLNIFQDMMLVEPLTNYHQCEVLVNLLNNLPL